MTKRYQRGSLSLIPVFWLPLWYLLAIVLYVFLWFLSSDYLFSIFKLFVLSKV
jgi:hypothetical protein